MSHCYQWSVDVTSIIISSGNRLMYREANAIKVMTMNTGIVDTVLTAEQMVSQKTARYNFILSHGVYAYKCIIIVPDMKRQVTSPISYIIALSIIKALLL